MAGVRHAWRCFARYSDGSTVGLKGNGRSTGSRDLPEPLGGRRLPRRGDREEDEVTLTGSDARGDLHLAKVPVSEPSTKRVLGVRNHSHSVRETRSVADCM